MTEQTVPKREKERLYAGTDFEGEVRATYLLYV